MSSRLISTTFRSTELLLYSFRPYYSPSAFHSIPPPAPPYILPADVCLSDHRRRYVNWRWQSSRYLRWSKPLGGFAVLATDHACRRAQTHLSVTQTRAYRYATAGYRMPTWLASAKPPRNDGRAGYVEPSGLLSLDTAPVSSCVRIKRRPINPRFN